MTTPAELPLSSNAAPGDRTHNIPERSVSELASQIKRTVEETYGRVRVRGEISQPKLAGSGHCYLRLKDDTAVIDAIIWRGSYTKLTVRPEEGLEVIATGRMTTYPGRSSYQIVIESLELAGEGALLKMLEERKRRLAAEGLFAAEGKRPLPFLPRTIGVVTSPTGAVIRDILHRLNDRFPTHVLVWPVLVQGDGAAEQVAAAVRGFNALDGQRGIARPDLLIVARGGGSLEDLMAFNEEVVVRAVAASEIPVISAVGHETDTTLCDFAADRRAPTPTGAAEMAVPVRLDLLAQVREDGQRLTGASRRLIDERALRLSGLARGLPQLERLVEDYAQRLDDRAERLDGAVRGYLDRRTADVRALGASLRSPREQIAAKQASLAQTAQALKAATDYVVRDQSRRVSHAADRLRPDGLIQGIARGQRDLHALDLRWQAAMGRQITDLGQRLEGFTARLSASSHEAVLRRGYAVVRTPSGAVMDSRALAIQQAALRLEFQDGMLDVLPAGDAPPTPPNSAPPNSASPNSVSPGTMPPDPSDDSSASKPARRLRKATKDDDRQETLF